MKAAFVKKNNDLNITCELNFGFRNQIKNQPWFCMIVEQNMQISAEFITSVLNQRTFLTSKSRAGTRAIALWGLWCGWCPPQTGSISTRAGTPYPPPSPSLSCTHYGPDMIYHSHFGSSTSLFLQVIFPHMLYQSAVQLFAAGELQCSLPGKILAMGLASAPTEST